MSDMSELKGKDCMVQEVVAYASNEFESRLSDLRNRQMERAIGEVFDVEREMSCLEVLLREAGVTGCLSHILVSSIAEIAELAGDSGVFVGFKKGPDNPPHIHYVNEVRDGWVGSGQGWLSPDVVIDELMRQGLIDAFVVHYQ